MNRAPAATQPPAPSARRGGRIFWGWWIVIGAVVGQFVGMCAGGSIAGVFLRPITEDLNWTSAEYTLGASAALVVVGLVSFVIGPLADRYGARPLMLVGACIYAASFLALSRVDALWQFIHPRRGTTDTRHLAVNHRIRAPHLSHLDGISSRHPIHDRQRFHTHRSSVGNRIERRREPSPKLIPTAGSA